MTGVRQWTLQKSGRRHSCRRRKGATVSPPAATGMSPPRANGHRSRLCQSINHLVFGIMSGMAKRADLKIPYGIADFKRIRNEGWYYVDKTEYLARLADDFANTTPNSWRRPRRASRSSAAMRPTRRSRRSRPARASTSSSTSSRALSSFAARRSRRRSDRRNRDDDGGIEMKED